MSEPGSFGYGIGLSYIGNSAGDLNLMEVGATAGELASRTEKELHAHASLGAHVAALIALAWPAHAAARSTSQT